MQRHPTLGAELLRRHAHIPERVIRIVEQHHEVADGSGYPNRLKADQIDPAVPIIALADSFSALTCLHSYRPHHETFAALQLQKQQLHKNFDVQHFEKFVPLFVGKSDDQNAA